MQRFLLTIIRFLRTLTNEALVCYAGDYEPPPASFKLVAVIT